jgi:hypothetical protein
MTYLIMFLPSKVIVAQQEIIVGFNKALKEN